MENNWQDSNTHHLFISNPELYSWCSIPQEEVFWRPKVDGVEMGKRLKFARDDIWEIQGNGFVKNALCPYSVWKPLNSCLKAFNYLFSVNQMCRSHRRVLLLFSCSLFLSSLLVPSLSWTQAEQEGIKCHSRLEQQDGATCRGCHGPDCA